MPENTVTQQYRDAYFALTSMTLQNDGWTRINNVKEFSALKPIYDSHKMRVYLVTVDTENCVLTQMVDSTDKPNDVRDEVLEHALSTYSSVYVYFIIGHVEPGSAMLAKVAHHVDALLTTFYADIIP